MCRCSKTQPSQTADVVIMRVCGHRETMTLTCRERDRNARVAEEGRKKCRGCKYGWVQLPGCRGSGLKVPVSIITTIAAASAKAGLTIDSLDAVKRFRDCYERLEDHSWLPLTAEQIKHHFSRRRLVRGRKTT